MSFKIVQPMVKFVRCPKCGSDSKVIRHSYDWNKDTQLDYIGPVRPKTNDSSKLKCDDCGNEFAMPL